MESPPVPRKLLDRLIQRSELGPPSAQLLELAQASIDRYRIAYELPDYVIDRARGMQIHEVTRRQLEAFIERQTRVDYEVARRKRKSLQDYPSPDRDDLKFALHVAKIINASGLGFSVWAENHQKILIPKDDKREEAHIQDIVDHEALHVLGDRGRDKGTGIMSETDEVTSPWKANIGRELNEALTEALRLAVSAQRFSSQDLAKICEDDTLFIGYRRNTRGLLRLLSSIARRTGNFSYIRDLSSLYVGLNNTTCEQARMKFLTQLDLHVNPEERRMLLTLHIEPSGIFDVIFPQPQSTTYIPVGNNPYSPLPTPTTTPPAILIPKTPPNIVFKSSKEPF